MVFHLRSCTRWQLGDGGVQPPLVRIFGGLERKLRCAQNSGFYTFFCLAVSRDFAKTVEIQGFLDVDQYNAVFTLFSCFAMVETALYTGFCVALRPGV